MDKFEEFQKAFDAHGPSQDNEGLMLSRGSFKAGFLAAWGILEAEILEIEGLETTCKIVEAANSQLREENKKLRAMWELRQGSPTRERYKQVVNKLKVQYHEKEALKGEVTKLKALLARAYDVCGPMQWGTLRRDIREVLEND